MSGLVRCELPRLADACAEPCTCEGGACVLRAGSDGGLFPTAGAGLLGGSPGRPGPCMRWPGEPEPEGSARRARFPCTCQSSSCTVEFEVVGVSSRSEGGRPGARKLLAVTKASSLMWERIHDTADSDDPSRALRTPPLPLEWVVCAVAGPSDAKGVAAACTAS